ncbi:MAG: alpha/beta hydrolase [Nitrospirae bacterium]|nr:alpha/beta hydrolase [Nitrospirota bacterium]
MSLLRIIAVVSSVLAAVTILLYFLQEKLIFYPQHISRETANHITSAFKNVREITIRTQDGTRLHGWFLKNSSGKISKLLFYFGGNAEEVSYMVYELQRYKDWSAVLVNYRGYGMSEGAPAEKKLCSDTLEIYDYFLKKPDIDNPKIAVMGRSLGSGVAVYLARNRKADGVILVSPFDSLASVGKGIFPFLPIRLILRHKFDSAVLAPKINLPLLVVTASDDKVVPPSHSKKLSEKWGGKVNAIEIKGEDHNSVSLRAEYWDGIGRFLDGL